MAEVNNSTHRYLTLGILAHVDAGKTTLTEAMLYLSGKLKRLGRVDRGDSFLDSHFLERRRGITIFSKQASIELPDLSLMLLDTPGHVDFSTEAERSLQVLDYAVLVISGSDGVQAHTETIWRLLERYNIPTFIFVTKMDIPTCNKDALIKDITQRLGEGCIDFAADEQEAFENISMCSENAMDEYLQNARLSDATLRRMISDREIFPCYFGSGLKAEGVAELLEALDKFTLTPEYGSDFSARVFKISRDAQGKRMTHIKLLGGELKVRSVISYTNADGKSVEEKINQLRIYSGDKYEAVDSIRAGQICTALGLSETYSGQALGEAKKIPAPVLEPVMSYRLILPQQTEPMLFLPKLMQLCQEDPKLNIEWDEQNKEISVQLMGKIQAEIFISLVKDRFDTDISLDSGRIMYRETIKELVEGVGHFEPLRHYAEVHLLLEPLPRGSGLIFTSACSEDMLDRNWQRLILTHLQEKKHIGVLTGSPITDIKISLTAGKAHIKHTEGGDFRQATYRAVRQGLMSAESVLLEPWYAFSIEVPSEHIGRAISDVRAMNGSFEAPELNGDLMRLEGAAPVVAMNEYAQELLAYTHGRGRLSLSSGGYRECADAKNVIASIAYKPERDEQNTADSVFCAHGAGVNIRWDQVRDYMHLESTLPSSKAEDKAIYTHRHISIEDRELEAIMLREFGPIKRPEYQSRQINTAQPAVYSQAKKEYVIVDGYNLIFAWDKLKALADDRLDLARGKLIDILSNYCGFTKKELVLVFDGYRTKGNTGTREEQHNIKLAYTKDGETADMYIERIVDEIGKNYSVRVVTSDSLIRLSALRSGVLRTSSAEFINEIEDIMAQIEKLVIKSNQGAHKTRLSDGKQ